MPVGVEVRVDSKMRQIPVGAIIRSKSKRTRFYMKISYTHFIRIDFTRVLDFSSKCIIMQEQLGYMPSGGYYLVQNKKERESFIKLIAKHGYKPKQETIYVKE